MADLAGLTAAIRDLLDRTGQSHSSCGCTTSHEDGTLVVDAADCPGGGDLPAQPDCRATVVRALADREVETVLVRATGLERAFEGPAAAFLAAAGRFAARVRYHDERLAARALRDPLAAATEAAGRAGPVETVGEATGLTAAAGSAAAYDDLLEPFVSPTVSAWRVARRPPPDARLAETRELDSGATARIYAASGQGYRRYHLEPRESGFDERALATLAAGRDRLAAGGPAPASARDPYRAVQETASDGDPVEALGAVLWKHTRGFGLLEDLFADPSVSDVFVTAPAPENPIRVHADGETLDTNLGLTETGVAALASRFRRESGRAFSRAAPTVDAAAEIADRRVRVAGVTRPASDGHAFAFRAHDRRNWTLPDLVANDTLTRRAAAVVSVAAERGRALLVTGPRGSGKTTLLAATLWELPPAVRTVVIEDAPELPLEALQRAGRDVQGLRATDAGQELDPADALRTALRLGDGALVVGEVRGEEASVLYEAMRVGANSEAVLGTIHGAGGESVYERVVSDLGVPPESFGITDLVVTLESVDTPRGAKRRVARIEEVRQGDPPTFHSLFDRGDGNLAPTGRMDRGNSHLVDSLAPPDGTYRDVLDAIDRRTERLTERGRVPDAETAAENRTGGPRGASR